MDTIEKHRALVEEIQKTRPLNMVAEYMKAYTPPPWPEEPVRTGVETQEFDPDDISDGDPYEDGEKPETDPTA